ncbi:hypothetical protein DI392_04395 [Vibrio albus]|uniref:Uncharacterized protein n=1 Tax=Vibrio albus TaxID=2200953 RepID=A0A2U3BC52_9VIBR|nr:BTAD domain-containing putative transcriptional regulator [Vibrio albus]PWI34357.1 hypothetical protein DI392_04395 [Vibrio albus]
MRYLLLLMTALSLPLNAAELSRYVALKVHKAFQVQQEESTAEAIGILEGIEPERAYDQAYLQKLLGVFYWQLEQGSQAEKALSRAVTLNALDKEQHLDTQRMLADIQLYQQNFIAAIDNYHAVIEQTKEPTKLAGYWLRVAQAYYFLEHWHDVLASVSAYKQNVRTPAISALKLQLAAELSLEQWERAVKTTQQLRRREPEQKEWWRQLYSLLLRTDHNREALAVVQQMERAGFVLTQTEIKTLAGLYADQKLPAQAAEYYTRLKGLETDAEMLATQARYWQQAREWDKSLLIWKKATEVDSQYRWPYARLLLQQNQYQQAITQLNLIDNPSEQVLLTKVQAYYRLNRLELAKKAANRAYRVAQNKAAREWLDYLDSL